MDEDVQKSIADFLRARGHTIHYVSQELPKGMSDRRIADLADDLAATVVTYNRAHFNKLISRRPREGDPQPRRHAGAVFLACKQPRGPQRIRACADLVEFELRRSLEHTDARAIVEIQAERVIILR